jgi:hypothetical protein
MSALSRISCPTCASISAHRAREEEECAAERSRCSSLARIWWSTRSISLWQDCRRGKEELELKWSQMCPSKPQRSPLQEYGCPASLCHLLVLLQLHLALALHRGVLVPHLLHLAAETVYLSLSLPAQETDTQTDA